MITLAALAGIVLVLFAVTIHNGIEAYRKRRTIRRRLTDHTREQRS